MVYLLLTVGLLAGMWYMHQHEKSMESSSTGKEQMRGLVEEAEKLACPE